MGTGIERFEQHVDDIEMAQGLAAELRFEG